MPVLTLAFILVALSQLFTIRIKFHIHVGVAVLLALSLAFADPQKPIWTQIQEHSYIAAAFVAVVGAAIHMYYTMQTHTRQIAKLEAIADTTTQGFVDVNTHIAKIENDIQWIKENWKK